MIEITVWDFVGGLGMACIEASYATQIVRLHKRKEADDISLFFPGLNLLGRILAMVASYNLGASVFVLGFFAGVILRSGFLFQVIWYRGVLRKLFLRPLAAAASTTEVKP